MELHQIRYFHALCNELNFTRAAERCSVAQSSLTRAIKALENELGGELFYRERANTRLSDLGQQVKPFLDQVYSQVEGARRQARDFLRLQASGLRLGLMHTIVPATMLKLAHALRAQHPDVALQIVDAPSQALQTRLIAGELDAAVYALPTLAADTRLHCLPLQRERFVIVVGQAHRLAGRGSVRAQDLKGEPYLRRSHCEYGAAADRFFAGQMAGEGPVHESDRDDGVLAMAAAGFGCALMPVSAARHVGVVALPLIEPEIFREIALVTVRGRPESPGVAALVHSVMGMDFGSAPPRIAASAAAIGAR